MADLQVKITIGAMDVFLQGEGELVYKILSDLRENGIGKLSDGGFSQNKEASAMQQETDKIEMDELKETGSASAMPSKTRKKSNQSTGQLLKDLDLSGRNGADCSLKDFIAEKNPTSNVQKTAAFVYYLENILKLDEITIDHVFTCYKTMGYRMPNNLQQNLTDTCSSRYGYISRKDGKFSMTVVGSNYIEFDIGKED